LRVRDTADGAARRGAEGLGIAMAGRREGETEGKEGTEEETAPWNWFRSMDHWKQSSLLNSPPAHLADIKASFGMIYREARRAAL